MSSSTELTDYIHYTDSGPAIAANRTFLLLHGLGGSLEFWCAVAPSLAKVDRTLAIDLPGFGRSQAPGDGLTLESVANAIIDFCQEMNIKDCTVVAHSLGGFIGLKVAATDPGLCRSLILVDAAPVRAMKILQRPARAFRRPVLAATMAIQFLAGAVPLRTGAAQFIARSRILRIASLWPFVARPALLDPKITAQALSYTGGVGTVIRAFRQSRQLDLLSLFDDIRVPIDLVRGERDNMNTESDVALVRQRAGVRRELVVKNCGHWLPIECPEILVDFIVSGE